MRAPSATRNWSIVGLTVVVAVAIEVAGFIYGWPIIRTAKYRVLVAQFAHAAPRPKIPAPGEHSEWDFVHSLSSGTTNA